MPVSVCGGGAGYCLWVSLCVHVCVCVLCVLGGGGLLSVGLWVCGSPASRAR